MLCLQYICSAQSKNQCPAQSRNSHFVAVELNKNSYLVKDSSGIFSVQIKNRGNVQYGDQLLNIPFVFYFIFNRSC